MSSTATSFPIPHLCTVQVSLLTQSICCSQIHEDLSKVKRFDAEGALGLKLLDALSSTPETSSSATKDLQSKLDAECLAEKTNVDF
jgi:hypothetical protein